MTQDVSTPHGETERFPAAKRRAAALVLLAAALAVAAASDALHSWLLMLLSRAEEIMRARPVMGMLLFVLFGAVSAMLAFVSSAVIVPIGVYVWGKWTSMLLLWIGWIIGGVCAYCIGRYFGRPVVTALTSGATFERYEKRISDRAPFGLVLLFQVALPSEVPGYLLGLLRYRFWKYLCALALAELPYSVATVYLGSSFIERRTYVLVEVGITVAVLSGWALYVLHRRVSEKQP